MKVLNEKLALTISILLLIGLTSCRSANRHEGWGQTTGEIIDIKAKEEKASKINTTCKYTVNFKYKVEGKSYSGKQVVEEAHAELIHPGQTLTVYVNPNDKGKSELNLPVPYPDKSGMNWRRMPKSLITKPDKTVH